jgi:hypothetical protein
VIRSQPCSACPYRVDVPSGVWAPEEYDKLRDYDKPTGDQPLASFACHATPDALCHGWAVVHNNRGHRFELLALRVHPDNPVPDEAVPLFDSGNDAADWGQRDADDPSPEAHEVMARLMRKYPRLRDE